MWDVLRRKPRDYWESHRNLMPPRYDLTIEKDGNLTVTRLDAKSRKEAKKDASRSGNKVKAIVFSDQNNVPTQNRGQCELPVSNQFTKM